MNNDNPAEISLSLPYRVEFLNLITGFVTESGQAFGANEKESFALRLAAEEVFTYIMEAFPPTDTDAVFHLKCIANDNKVTFSFSNHGTPLNARSTPEFTIDDIDATIDGLGLDMIRKLTDNFQFVNCGSEGWLIIFTKQLAEFHSICCKQPEPEATDLQPSNQNLRIFRATAEHVPQLISLVYRTYRYSYAKDYFYNNESLQQALAEERVVALVAEDENGRIVGNVAVFFDSPQVAEIGGVMIDPQYRASMGMLLLIKESKKLFGRDSYKNTTFYTKTVTTHTYSQQLMSALKFAPLGLRLSVYNHAKFIGIDEERGHRESLIFAVFTANLKSKTVMLNVPDAHKGIIGTMFDSAGIVVEMNSETASLERETVLTVHLNDKTQFAEIDIRQLGLDFAAILKKETFTLQQNGYITCLLNIPADKALPLGLNELLKENKFFFCGLQLNKEGHWLLMYTNLFHQRFQFANVKLFDPAALMLRDYIEGEYLSIY